MAAVKKRRRRVTPGVAGSNRRRHVRLNLRLGNRVIGNPDIIDAAVELIHPRRSRTLADLYVECRCLLCCGNRAEKLSVVELTI